MQAEAALREAEERFRLTVEAAPHGVLLVDARGRMELVNREIEAMFGYAREELLGQPVEILLPDKLRQGHAAERGAYVREPEPRHIGVGRELSGRRKNGVVFPLEVGLSPVQADAGTLVLATVVDISARRQAEDALRESERRFRLLTESLPQLVWTCEPSGSCDFLSPQWAEYTGVPVAEQLGNGWLMQVHPDDREKVIAAWSAALGTGNDMHIELRLRRHDGSYRWFDMRTVRMADDAGRTVKWLGSSTDIDDNKRSEQSLLRTQKMEALGTLAGGIAHDFNNILLAIMGNAQLARADLPDDHPVQESLLEIEKAGERASNLVRRILSFSQHQEPKKEVMALQPVAEEVLKLLRATLPPTTEIRTDFSTHVPCIHADSTQVYQTVMNLATNAAQAIGKGPGMVEISIDAADVDGELAGSMPGLQPGHFVRLSVADNGSGMEEQVLQRIFDPFYTTKPAGQGTGLGLSIVAGIMRNHEGGISVSSQPGKGTRFQLYFPAIAAGALPQPAPPAGPLLRAGHEHVLYVDDEEALVLLVSRKLERLGYRVTGCTDPLQALELLRSHSSDIDVVVTDLAMPTMSGFEFARALLARQPDMPVIVTSGYVRPEDQQEALAMGIRAMIMKPNTVDELGAMLNRMFRNGTADGNAGEAQ
jgi:PAS domain S-box-containing protein